MTELAYQPHEEQGRQGWLKRLLSNMGAGVVQGGEINSGIVPAEQRPHVSESHVAPVVNVNGENVSDEVTYTEAEKQAMVDSADPSHQV